MICSNHSEPGLVFQQWYQSARECDAIRHPTAMCLSTREAGGEVQARFVDLKRYDHRGFIFTSYTTSAKSHAIKSNPGVSLTFWWDALGRQVRVGGTASLMDDMVSDEFFAASKREAQILVLASKQSEILESRETLAQRMAELGESYEGKQIARPAYWSAFLVVPESMEFLQLEADRIHMRKRYVLNGQRWDAQMLQP